MVHSSGISDIFSSGIMPENVWESRYFDVYDKILLNSDIYLAVRDFHTSAVSGHPLVLDSGCGTGNVTIELLKNKHSVHAIDTSRKALGILKNKCAINTEFLHICNTHALQGQRVQRSHINVRRVLHQRHRNISERDVLCPESRRHSRPDRQSLVTKHV